MLPLARGAKLCLDKYRKGFHGDDNDDGDDDDDGDDGDGDDDDDGDERDGVVSPHVSSVNSTNKYPLPSFRAL